MLDAQSNGVFTVGNYYFNGVGHVCVDYGKVLREGFSGIIHEAEAQKAKLSGASPEDIKKRDFYNAVIITYKAAIAYAHRYADLCEQLAAKESNQTRQDECGRWLRIVVVCQNIRREHGGKPFNLLVCPTYFAD